LTGRPLSVATGHSFQADFWALGVTIYEMLTGKTPFQTRGGGFATYRKVRA
jgi:serine/threonine protein kinase